MANAGQGARAGTGGFWCRCWLNALDFFLTLWVLRVPVAIGAIGAVLMWFVPQAQDLLVELAMPSSVGGWARTIGFFPLVLFVWAMPMHYGARLLVESDKRYNTWITAGGRPLIVWLKEWMPRLLGAFTFVVMFGGALRAWLSLPEIADQKLLAHITVGLLLIAAGLIIFGGAFWLYAVYRDEIAKTGAVRGLEALAARIIGPLRVRAPALSSEPAGSGSDLGPLLLIGMSVIFALAPTVATLWFAETMPRALSVPFALGGWVPLLVYLGGLGRRVRAPFIFIAFVVVTMLPMVFGTNYAVRRINAAEMVKDITKTAPKGSVVDAFELDKAIGWWKTANDCSGSGQTCPRPIIVATAGGASRAGFFEASLIGQLLEDQLKRGGRGHNLSRDKMANRLFAFSTVSGSSVGAVTTVAALAAAKPDGGHSCAKTTEPLWYGTTIGNWRDCLEALMAGDFLTPIFAGFIFHDVFGFLHIPDRGSLLEESVERQFAKLIGKDASNRSQLACVGNLECPFMTLRPTPARWLPVLLVNSTSVGSGQRVITTPLLWHIDLKNQDTCPTDIRDDTCQIFQRAPLYHDMIIERDPGKLDDLRLSTAAHNSARFPLLSPPGELIDSKGGLIDRLVDGGYFENFGAQTATELALAMRAIDPNLKPFILVLSNDPQAIVPKKSLPPDEMSPRALLPDLFAPLGAFANTRNARGKLAVDNAASALDHFNPVLCNKVTLRVWTRPETDKPNSKARDLSMSWWLSKPVQIYLRQQTGDGATDSEGKKNDDAIAALLAAIRGDPPPADGKKAACAAEVD